MQGEQFKMNIQSTKVNKASDELWIMNNARQIIQDEYTNVSRVNNTTERKVKATKEVNKERLKVKVDNEVKGR